MPQLKSVEKGKNYTDRRVKRPKKKDTDSDEKKVATQLPTPCGYKLLIGLPEIDETTEGGIAMPKTTRDREEVASIVGFVLAVGPEAYKDKSKFSEPYCKEGDFILMRSYSGTRFSVHGTELRLINDDSVEAVVQDPRSIRKV